MSHVMSCHIVVAPRLVIYTDVDSTNSRLQTQNQWRKEIETIEQDIKITQNKMN